MSMNEVIDRYSIVVALLGLAIWVSTIATLKVLHTLKTRRPEKLEAVGIKQIDWWFACWRGIGLLAFSKHGHDLSAGQLLALRSVVLSSGSFLLAAAVVCLIGQY